MQRCWCSDPYFYYLFLPPFYQMFQSVPQRAGFMLYAKTHLMTSRDFFQRGLYLLVTGTGTTVWLCIQLCKSKSFVADLFPLPGSTYKHVLHSKLNSFTNYSYQRRVFLVVRILKISITLCLPVMKWTQKL